MSLLPLSRLHDPDAVEVALCKPHWFMVPAPIRRRVWAAYDALPHRPAGN
jgi:hypothetical protein